MFLTQISKNSHFQVPLLYTEQVTMQLFTFLQGRTFTQNCIIVTNMF